MKVLHVITSLRTGGAEKLMVDLLPRFRSMGVKTDLCVFDGARTPFYEELEAKGIKIIPLGKNVYSPMNAVRLMRLMKKYDVVHSHNTACQYYVALAGFFTSCKLFTTEHNATNRRRCTVWKVVDRWMYGQYDKVVCISEQVRDNLLRHIGDDFCNKCVLIYNGIDLEHFVNKGVCEEMEHEHKIIIMVSAFRIQKDQKTLIKAIAIMPENYQLLLVGGGEGVLIEECKSLVKELSMDYRVKFMGVRMDVVALLQRADVAVMSSHYEGFSLSSVEAMACGKPLIASDVDGLREIVGGYGVLFPHGNHESLASSIKCLCEDEAYRAEVVSRCVARANMFDINMMADKYMNLYYAL